MNYNYYEPFDNYNIPTNQNNTDSLFGSYEGYLKGNLFKNLYNEYKNYKPSIIKINSDKEELLFNLNQICFAMHELNLYLDVYPNNKQILDLYSNYQSTYNDLLNTYQEKYVPINTNSIKNSVPFSWVNTNFPWEVE